MRVSETVLCVNGLAPDQQIFRLQTGLKHTNGFADEEDGESSHAGEQGMRGEGKFADSPIYYRLRAFSVDWTSEFIDMGLFTGGDTSATSVKARVGRSLEGS
jgi:hypothetical protein